MSAHVYSVSRRIVGALPSKSFSPPSSCKTPWIYSGDVGFTGFYYAASCSTTDSAAPHIESDAACYPSSWARVAAYAILDFPFYSPASICPTGFTSACNVTRNAFDPVPASLTYGEDPASETLSVLSDGETAIGCCPTGFTCDTLSVRQCISTLSSGNVVAGVTYGRSCAMSSTTVTVSETMSFLLPPIATVLQVVLVHDPAKDNRTSTDAAGLSTGAKIGIGLAVPIGLLAICVLVFIFYHRKKKSRKAVSRSSDPREDPVLPPNLAKPELKGSEVVVTSNQPQKPIQEKSELDNSPLVLLLPQERRLRPLLVGQ